MEAAGTAPAKEPGNPQGLMDVLDCARLGLRSMDEFEALLDRYLERVSYTGPEILL